VTIGPRDPEVSTVVEEKEYDESGILSLSIWRGDFRARAIRGGALGNRKGYCVKRCKWVEWLKTGERDGVLQLETRT
jgi:hypothetical protein